MEILELTKDNEVKSHWKLPDFGPMDRLILPGKVGPGSFIIHVTIPISYVVLGVVT